MYAMAFMGYLSGLGNKYPLNNYRRQNEYKLINPLNIPPIIQIRPTKYLNRSSGLYPEMRQSAQPMAKREPHNSASRVSGHQQLLLKKQSTAA